jgi:DnaJ-class molecular chaperone
MNKDDPAASKKFMEITEAYEVLGDDKKREVRKEEREERCESKGEGGAWGREMEGKGEGRGLKPGRRGFQGRRALLGCRGGSVACGAVG